MFSKLHNCKIYIKHITSRLAKQSVADNISRKLKNFPCDAFFGLLPPKNVLVKVVNN